MTLMFWPDKLKALQFTEKEKAEKSRLMRTMETLSSALARLIMGQCKMNR